MAGMMMTLFGMACAWMLIPALLQAQTPASANLHPIVPPMGNPLRPPVLPPAGHRVVPSMTDPLRPPVHLPANGTGIASPVFGIGVPASCRHLHLFGVPHVHIIPHNFGLTRSHFATPIVPQPLKGIR